MEQTMAGRLEGKVAVVTGSGSGIGEATARRFHQEGAKVVLADISGNQDAIAKELGDGATGIQADVTNGTSVQELIAATVSTYGRLDVLYNNAGIDGDFHKVGEMPEESWDRVQSVNLRGVFLGLRYGIPAMLESGGGSIINTASMAATVAFPTMASYCAAKGGVVMLTKTAAAEYAGEGIRVNSISPGSIFTAISEHLPPDLINTIVEKNPIPRFGTVDEVASLALFLASDESGFTTGSDYVIDGGYTLV
jgi:NAD(P)-dependent dehydrogenase (short-subunit alcohol dehydrogenase family)